MKAVRKIIENAPGTISIDVPDEMRNQKLEVILLSADESQVQQIDPMDKPAKKYDFSDFFGKLQWQGDAVAEQRRLRDEWE
ncbi:hypothetical protein [Paracnuella aquatica]|uniref:hypothetical protein n=1 Tax=Paracnuella aquatica TaxID=2268757 RepID=UPI000DEF3A99|nr:hypothetical protein [Paracnuella aquatica]RPD50704.1 hypothetical protein DRJ53_07225 [Paracnuella aquatica]